MSDNDDLRKIVNSSGFPLQISIENEVRLKEGQHGWHVLSKEYSWSDTNGNSGFIDLILEDRNKEYFLVVECKRVLNSNWIFLLPSSKERNRRHIKAWVSYKRQGNMEKLNWTDHPGDQESLESEFCVVLGQDPRSKPMLERVASDLVLATESFALEDNNYYDATSDYLRIAVPIIVTTADLKVCVLSPDDISISSGELSSADFKTVPYLRFRKQLSTRSTEDFLSSGRVDYRNITYAKENTVFIVNSNHLTDFLEKFEIEE
jgi:hypothetical protein